MNPDLPEADAPKARWRTWAKLARLSAGDAPPHVRDQTIAAHVRAWKAYRDARHVLFYLPAPGEVDLTELTRDPSRTLYTTRTWPRPDLPLTVHPYDPETLETHAFGFTQPSATAASVDPGILELALVPGLAFDAAGTRLGYGRGYFDRLLAELPTAAVKVGVAPLATVVPRLPHEPHDVPMDYLVTERGVQAVARARS